MTDDERAKRRRLRDACRELLQARADHPEIFANTVLRELNDENWETLRELAEMELDE
jgi:hypothetical protein